MKWSVIATHLPGRIGKQCRERWFNHLDPNVKKGVRTCCCVNSSVGCDGAFAGAWTAEEDQVIFNEQRRIGNKCD